MNQSDTDILVGAIDSIASSLETLTRIAVHMALNAGVPAEIISPADDTPTPTPGT